MRYSRAGGTRSGCTLPGQVPYLVVHHHVDGAVGGVGRQVGKVERLVHEALARERRVAVNQDGHHL